ncbi:hypothetical protein V6N13_132095 [Hibiscus sabdariffa]|uniref:Uncharacterized protein n=1 Tax=Hibiscus sabdariffa TaxID=183260 RepID=A0ABR2BCA2_9ROSI
MSLFSTIEEGHASRETITSKAWCRQLVSAGWLRSSGGFRGRGDLPRQQSIVNKPAIASPQLDASTTSFGHNNIDQRRF